MGLIVDVVHRILHQVKQTMAAHNMVETGDRVVVAVSGGPDSVCLLDVLYRLRDELGLELYVAHFNHGLRPHEDEGETEFVRSLAATLGLPLKAGKVDPPGFTGSSLEEKARLARYEFLEKVQRELLAQKIALGHSLNDQAETLIMRLLRGSGPKGLAGIPPQRSPGIIRPLLEIPRSQIRAYLADRGLGWVTDSSNLERRHLRNRIRAELMPLLEEYQPRVLHILGQTGEVLRRDDACLEAQAGEWLEENAGVPKDRETRIPLKPFLRLPAALKSRVLRLAILRLGEHFLRRIGFRHLEAVISLAEGNQPNAEIVLPHGVVVYRVYDHLVFSTGGRGATTGYRYVLPEPGIYQLDAVGMILRLDEGTEVETRDSGSQIAHLDAEKLGYPLVVRNMRKGDRFVPLGMEGSKKLKDFFIDRKIPLTDRYRIPILTYRDQPVWICGMRIDDRYKVTQRTRRVLKIRIGEKNE